MTPTILRALAAFDASLTEGQAVRVSWTHSYHTYDATGIITTLNSKSVKVAIDAEIRADTHLGKDQVLYPKGQQIRVPRLIAIKQWTANNCVLPLEEEEGP
jgi:hypothetical protein